MPGRSSGAPWCIEIMLDTKGTKKSRTRVGLVLVVATLGAFFASNSPAQAKTRHCGKVTAVRDRHKSRFSVRIAHGSVSCKTARWAIKAYNSGKGTLHKAGPGRGNWYTTLPGGWSCSSGAGGEEACVRGPKINSYEHRDQIYATSI